jgi:Cytochrome P460
MRYFTMRISGVLVLAAALTGAALAQMPAPFHAAQGAPSPGRGADIPRKAPSIVPSGFGDAVDRDVARSRAATERFRSSDAAVAAGYARVTDCVEHQPDGAMGYHFQNNSLLDTKLDVERPEVLVYERKADGTFKLNGVEHLVPISAWTAPEPPRIMGQALKRADSLGIWYLHVWTWEPSPSGLFADWNPRVKCGAAADASSNAHQHPVPYPEGFRSWTVVKSLVVGPDHESFAKRGGIHHYYANDKAVVGYRTGTFPDGSIVVDEAVFTKDGDGRAKGILLEADRRFLDVMVKDGGRFETTGGWGYEHFDGDDRTGRLSENDRAACSACHMKAQTDHVFSRMRP